MLHVNGRPNSYAKYDGIYILLPTICVCSDD